MGMEAAGHGREKLLLAMDSKRVGGRGRAELPVRCRGEGEAGAHVHGAEEQGTRARRRIGRALGWSAAMGGRDGRAAALRAAVKKRRRQGGE
jgi:hypothetical protein